MTDSSVNNTVLGLEIKQCKILSSKGEEMDFKNAVTEYNYYEDLFSNFVYGTLMISDSNAFQNKHHWTGEEKLILEIDKPQNNGKALPLKGEYKIFQMETRKLGNDTNENLTINFCSPQLSLSNQIKISKSYKGKKISDIVKDICKTFLGLRVEDEKDENGKVIKPSQLLVEPTLGTRDVVIPKLSPFEAINWLATQAISEEIGLEGGANYHFWQNRDGFFFQSMLHRLNRVGDYQYTPPLSKEGQSGGKGSGYWYGTKNIEYQQPRWDPYEQIISFEVLDTYDTVKSAKKGMFANRLLSIDYLRRTHENADFDFNKYWNFINKNIQMYKDEYFNNVRTFGKYSPAPDIDNSKESTIKVYPSTTNQKKNPYIKGRQPNISSNYVEQFVPYRYGQTGLSGHNRIKILVPGDPYISVGKIVYVHFPKTSKGMTNATQEDVEDKFLAGFYMISAVRHMLNQENEFNTALELIKDSYHKPANEGKKENTETEDNES